MKTSFIKYILAGATLCFALNISAQDTKPTEASKGKTVTIEVKVKGVCGMCGTRIETAVYDLKGVKSAEWDLDTDLLTVIAKKGKVTKEQIAEALSEAGHDNELKKATPEAYDELPGCCKYNDGVEKHGDGQP